MVNGSRNATGDDIGARIIARLDRHSELLSTILDTQATLLRGLVLIHGVLEQLTDDQAEDDGPGFDLDGNPNRPDRDTNEPL